MHDRRGGRPRGSRRSPGRGCRDAPAWPKRRGRCRPDRCARARSPIFSASMDLQNSPARALAEHVAGVLRQHRLDEALQHEGLELAVGVEPAARAPRCGGRARTGIGSCVGGLLALAPGARRGRAAAAGRAQARKPLHGRPVFSGSAARATSSTMSDGGVIATMRAIHRNSWADALCSDNLTGGLWSCGQRSARRCPGAPCARARAAASCSCCQRQALATSSRAPACSISISACACLRTRHPLRLFRQRAEPASRGVDEQAMQGIRRR